MPKATLFIIAQNCNKLNLFQLENEQNKIYVYSQVIPNTEKHG